MLTLDAVSAINPLSLMNSSPEPRRDEGPATTGSVVRKRLALMAAAGVLLLPLWRATPRSAELPVDVAQRLDGWADEARCQECHDQAESFAGSGHANTLRQAIDSESWETLQRINDFPQAREEGLRVERIGDEIFAIRTVDGVERRVRIDWCFGSGHHAFTWVGTLIDSWGTTDELEFRWTWYRELDGFDITPGQPPSLTPTFFGGIGMLYDHPKTRRCFTCHARHVPFEDGRIDEAHVACGVTCQRCHGPRLRHVESEGAIVDPIWRDLSREESVSRCAECHRRADEQKPEDIRPDNRHITRFQPVGLTQSPCYLESPTMTCITCHDPHRSLAAQDSRGIWQCVQCHDGQASKRPLCAAGHTADCLRCHMPRVGSDSRLKFTDHWIRIRDDIGEGTATGGVP